MRKSFQKFFASSNKKSRYLIGFGILAILFMILIMAPDVRILSHNNQTIRSLEVDGESEDIQKFDLPPLASLSKLTYVVRQNSALLKHRNKDYTTAVTEQLSIAREFCGLSAVDQSTIKNMRLLSRKYCDHILYNLGNGLYRQGELLDPMDPESMKLQRTLWTNAIAMYQNELTVHPDDNHARENIDFIVKKLNGEDPSEEDQGEDQEGEDSDDEESKSGEEDGDSDENQEGSESKKDDQTEGKEQSGQGESDEPKLTDEVSQKLEQYMQDLEQKSRNLEQYFQQNGQAQASQNNSLVQQLFGGQLGQEQKSLDKDW
jgi:hypothetical protein